ncbi:hypothetical protein QYF61_005102 [Mycteria americana]|uniref:Uncharacterized protein n=1 Tax=Mycteria americana TaxID=33587 RepID=A0AAN7MPY6_MYCAM|nr:hypothetical protein QYF61_005102 [Mycteria americana]
MKTNHHFWEQFYWPAKRVPRENGILATSSVARKLFALLRFLPESGIALLLGCTPEQTHLQTHPSSPTGQQNHHATDGRSHSAILPRQNSKRQAEAMTWLKTCTGAGQWVLTLAHPKGIRQEFANRAGLKHVLALPCFRGKRVSCGHQDDHTFPSRATVPSASGEGLHCPSLDTLQPLNVSLVVRGPKLNTVFEVWPHQCRVQGHDHFPSPAGHTISDTSQDAICLLGHLGTLLAHIQPAVTQHPQVLFHRAALQPLFPKPVALHGVVVTQVQDLALSLAEPHTIDLGPSIQPVQVPLQNVPTLKQINTPTQLGVICRLTEGALDPFVQIIDRDIKQNWPQY